MMPDFCLTSFGMLAVVGEVFDGVRKRLLLDDVLSLNLRVRMAAWQEFRESKRSQPACLRPLYKSRDRIDLSDVY